MGVTHAHIFDSCLERYKTCKEIAHNVRIGWGMEQSSGLAKNDVAQNFTIDFELAGERALSGQGKKLLIFRAYLCGCVGYNSCVRLLRVRQDVFDQWTDEIRNQAGRELRRRGVWPVGKYFGVEEQK